MAEGPITRSQTARSRLTSSSSSASIKKSSSSLVSKCVSLTKCGYYKFSGDRQGASESCYTLWNIFETLGLKDSDLPVELEGLLGVKKLLKGQNDKIAQTCFQNILKTSNASKKLVVICDSLIPLPSLADIIASPKSKPDILICNKDNECEIALIGEVQSSPMIWTEKKAILGATDLFRGLRETSSIPYVEVFALPNTESPGCITSITVSWNKKFLFTAHLKRFELVVEGIEYIKQVVVNHCKNVTRLNLKLTNTSHYLVRLTNEELVSAAAALGASAVENSQLRSRTHILIKSGQTVYKMMHNSTEKNSIHLVVQKFSSLVTPPKHLVKIQICASYPIVIKYTYVPFNYFNRQEALTCFKQFMKKVKVALDELHDLDIAHNDVRLENILFNSEYEPIFIDFDRASPTNESYELLNSEVQSCMYIRKVAEVEEYPGIKTDLHQLGWMAAWILTDSLDYHNRNWDAQEPEIKANKFLECLIQNGEFRLDHLETIQPDDTHQIKEVLVNR